MTVMGNAQIIIVEDEGIVASDLKRRLGQLGYDVKAIVSSGEEAIIQAKKCKPDLVLMDIVLKGSMDGITAANKIHALFNIPVVYLTAYADGETLKRVKISEPYGYLVKPFEERELIAAIEIALERHKNVLKLKEKEQHFRFFQPSSVHFELLRKYFPQIRHFFFFIIHIIIPHC